jgi:hypothetical protein
MANRPIRILGVNPDNSLELSDHGRTVAQPGDTITWIIGNDTITGITSIDAKDGQPNVFNPNPGPVGASSNWQGTVARDISHNMDEGYSIGYSTSNGNFVHDPIIAIRPSTFHFEKVAMIATAVVLTAVTLALCFRKTKKKKIW